MHMTVTAENTIGKKIIIFFFLFSFSFCFDYSTADLPC